MLLYRRLASPLHAVRASVGVVWVAALVGAALASDNPLVLAALGAAILSAGIAAGVGRALLGALRPAAIMGVPIVLVNLIVARQGLTVFARLGDLGPFGQGDLTVEALAYGAVVALKVGLLPLVATFAALAVDPDELLRAMRRLSFRSALTASLATRMIGVLGADAQRLAEAQRTRPPGAPHGSPPGGRSPGGLPHLARRRAAVRMRARAALLGAVVGSSLDRALDVAATLELRGFAVAHRPPRLARPYSRHDLAFLASALAVVVLALMGRIWGAESFTAYPELRCAAGAATFGLCAALLAAVLAPFADRRGIEP